MDYEAWTWSQRQVALRLASAVLVRESFIREYAVTSETMEELRALSSWLLRFAEMTFDKTFVDRWEATFETRPDTPA